MCEIEDDTVYSSAVANTVLQVTLGTTSACCDLCGNLAYCTAFNFNKITLFCSLLSNVDFTTIPFDQTGYVSGVIIR